MERGGRRELLVSRTWFQVAALVVLLGFFVLGFLAYRTYRSDPPIPSAQSTRAARRPSTTGDDVRGDKKVFLHKGLIGGSIFGHGAYLGPDFGRLPPPVLGLGPRAAGGRGVRLGAPGDHRSVPGQPLRLRDRHPALSAEQANAFEELNRHYEGFFRGPTTRFPACGPSRSTPV